MWYGGQPSVDFVNTRKHVTGEELLGRPRDLEEWLMAAGIVSDPVRVDEPLLGLARELRDAIDLGIRASIAGGTFPPAAADVINACLARSATRPPRLELTGGAPVLMIGAPSPDAHGALRVLAADAAELLGTEARGKLRICAWPTCQDRFVDNSVGQRRRWCSMATCGNRAKAARFRRAAARAAARAE